MSSRDARSGWTVVLGSALLVIGCGGGMERARSAEDLSAALITVDDLVGDWEVNLGPDDAAMDESGVVPEEARPLLPSIELCEEASEESRSAVESLRVLAFRQLDLTVDDPIEVPFDREGHIVFVQEFLHSTDEESLDATFDAVAAGVRACLGDLPAGEEGPGTAEEVDAPQVGDERVAVLMLIEEAGGWAEWRVHQTLVRDGATLLSFVVVDIRAGEGVEPYFTDAEIDTMVETTAERL
ncbi:MAG: hypothetical protein RIR49_1730 [Actinomycetota bacterium]